VYPPLQSDSPWGYRPRPNRCAESPGTIDFVIALLDLGPQAKTHPIFAFLKSRMTDIHPFKGYQDSQTIVVDAILGPLDALNALAPSILA